MPISLQYPIFLIPLGSGFVSVVDSSSSDDPQHMLAVFTNRQVAEAFADQHGIAETPRALNNSREFAWLLQSLKAPVTQVAFDPIADDQSVTTDWTAEVTSLLEEHLEIDNSPWNYPVFVIAQEEGFVAIDGQASDGRAVQTVCLFTQAEKADAYLDDSGEQGRVESLEDRQAARDFLEQLSPDVTAVALDPVVSEGQHSAEYCFPVATLLDKYLA